MHGRIGALTCLMLVRNIGFLVVILRIGIFIL